MISIMHVVDLPCSNPWLNGVARFHDREQFRHAAISIGPRNDMHSAFEENGGSALALNSLSRTSYPLAVCRLARILRREQIDLVQTHLFYPSIIGLAAAKVARTPVTIVTRHHSDFTTLYNRPLHRRMDRWQALAADRVMAASEAVKRSMIRFERVPADKIAVARYGYDFDELRPRLSAERRKQLRESLGGDDKYFIGTISRLSIEKGHEYLLSAMVDIARQRPDVRLLLVGNGPLESELQDRVRGLGISDYVAFLGWRADAKDIIEAVDLVVHPTLHEAFCSVIIEAMALQKPLIATNVAAAPEQVDHDESGILLPARNPQAIAEAVLDLMSHPDKAASLAAEARRRVNERFTFPKMMLEYEACYRQLYCNRTKRTRRECIPGGADAK